MDGKVSRQSSIGSRQFSVGSYRALERPNISPIRNVIEKRYK